MRPFFCFLTCTFLVAGCAGPSDKTVYNEQVETHQIAMNVDEAAESRFEDFFTIEKMVQLETNESCFMSDINKLLTTEDSVIVIWDKSQDAIFSFDKEGTFLHSIKALGKGPEEYRGISDVTYNREKRCITVLDVASRALVCFSITDGSFERRMSFRDRELPGYTLDYAPGNSYLFNRMNTPHSRHDDAQMIAIDGDDLTVVAAGLPRFHALEGNRIRMSRVLDVHGDKAYMVEMVNDTIYTFDRVSPGFLPEFSFAYKDNVANKVAEKIKSGDNPYGNDVYPHLVEDGGISTISNLFRVDGYLYFSFTYQKRSCLNIYKESDGQTHRVPSQLEFDGQSIIDFPIGKLGDDLLVGKVFPKKIDDAFFSKNPKLGFYRITL